VTRKPLKWLAFFSLGVVVVMGAIYGSIAGSEGKPAADYEFFRQDASRPLVIAHRGGGALAPENTLYAFRRAIDLGADVLELDVRGTADGKLVVMHDATLDRTTDGAGQVNEKTLEELKKLDAAYRWTTDSGKTYPLRETGITIPTLEEVFTAFPGMKFNIEPKQAAPSLVKPLCEIIRRHKMADKIVVGSFNQTVLDDFRRECPEVATSASPYEVGKFLTLYKTGLQESYSPRMQALQIPEYIDVTSEFIDAAHKRNLKVHVWTVNDPAEMQRLLDAGVDGIITDYPDRLLELLGRKAPGK
jgi:glycerophosphoryl diester phosphodiesterase